MTLYELTGQESGIIIYGGNSVAVDNWASLNDNCMPFQFAGGMIGMPQEEGYFDDAKVSVVEDWRNTLPGSVWLTGETDEEGKRLVDTDLDIVADPNGDIPSAFLPENTDGDYSAKVYCLTSGITIIAPIGWN